MFPPRLAPDDLEQYAAALKRLARGLVREADADDLVQDTLVAAWQSPRGPRYGMGGWLRGIARNLAAKRYRESARRVRREAAASEDRAPSTAEVLARLDLQRRVLREVEGLDEPYRRAIYLRYFEDEPPRVIARRLKAPVATVHTWLRRGRERLRERLDEAHGGRRADWIALMAPLPALPTAVHLLVGALLVKRTVIVVAVLALLTVVAWQADLLPDLGHGGGGAAPLRTEPVDEAESARLVGLAPGGERVEAGPTSDEAAADPGPTHRLQLRLVADGGLPNSTARVTIKPIRHMQAGDRWDLSDVSVEARSSRRGPDCPSRRRNRSDTAPATVFPRRCERRSTRCCWRSSS